MDSSGPTQDPTVNRVIDQFVARSEEGMAKYRQSMSDNPMSAVEWLAELQTELMDATLYAERMKDELGRPFRFEPPGRRMSYNEDLVIKSHSDPSQVAFRLTLSWSIDERTGRPYEFFVVDAGKPGELQDALREIGLRVSRIMQGRYDAPKSDS